MGQISLDLYVLWSTWNSYKQLHCDLVQRFIALDVCRCCIVFATVAASALFFFGECNVRGHYYFTVVALRALRTMPFGGDAITPQHTHTVSSTLFIFWWSSIIMTINCDSHSRAFIYANLSASTDKTMKDELNIFIDFFFMMLMHPKWKGKCKWLLDCQSKNAWLIIWLCDTYICRLAYTITLCATQQIHKLISKSRSAILSLLHMCNRPLLYVCETKCYASLPIIYTL